MIIRFDAAAHDEFVRALAASTAAISTALDDLETAAARMRENWDGDAQEAFDAAGAQWAAQMTGIRDVLDAAAALASSTRMRFADAESAALAMWE